MSKPLGLKTTLKDNSRKKYRENSEWQTGKKIGRKKQVFNAYTKTWEKVIA